MEERHLHMLHGVTKKGLDTGVSKSHPFTTCDTDSYEAPIIPPSPGALRPASLRNPHV